MTYSCGLTEVVVPGAVYTVADDAQKCAQGIPIGETGRGGGTALALGAAAAIVGGVLLLNRDSSNNKPASP